MSVFLKNLIKSFKRAKISLYPRFNNSPSPSFASQLLSSITGPHNRSICFGNPNRNKRKQLMQKYNLYPDRNVNRKPKKAPDKPRLCPILKKKSFVSSRPVSCSVNEDTVEDSINYEENGGFFKEAKRLEEKLAKLAALNPNRKIVQKLEPVNDCREKLSKIEEEVESMEEQATEPEPRKISRPRFETGLTETSIRNNNTFKAKQTFKKLEDTSKVFEKNLDETEYTEEEEAEPVKTIPKIKFAGSDRDDRALTGTWVSRKCIRFDYVPDNQNEIIKLEEPKLNYKNMVAKGCTMEALQGTWVSKKCIRFDFANPKKQKCAK